VNRTLSSLRALFTAPGMAGAVAAGLAFFAVVQGAVSGPRWLLLTGLPASALALAVFGKLGEPSRSYAVRGPRGGGPRAFAPAVVHGVRAVHKETGRPVADGSALATVFEFDLTVVPEDGLPAYRVLVRHPLDVQGLLHRSSGVVEYDPRQPWRVAVPADPPREWLARAIGVTAPAEVTTYTSGPPAGLRTFVASLVCAAMLLVLVRLVG
jgi:hypothetical protein